MSKNNMIKGLCQRLKGKNLDDLCEEISVLDEWENEQSGSLGKDGWFAVCTDEGIVAYFGTSAEAYRYRLELINLVLNL